MISIIAAMGLNNEIGFKNKLPWGKFPADLKRFKELTLGKPVIMGRKTYESIGGALPGRDTIVISGNRNYTLNDAAVCNSINSAASLAHTLGDEIMIAGGADIYREFMGCANRIYLTIIKKEFEADAYFPKFKSSDFSIVSRDQFIADATNPFDYDFCLFDKYKHR